MDLSSVSVLSIEEQGQEISGPCYRRRATSRSGTCGSRAASAEEHATATRLQEEAASKSTYAQDEEPAIGETATYSEPAPCKIRKSFLQQQVISTRQASVFRVSHSSFKPAPFDGCFKQENVQQRVMVFERCIHAFVWETGGLEAIETCLPIKVGRTESSNEALTDERGVDCKVSGGHDGNDMPGLNKLLG